MIFAFCRKNVAEIIFSVNADHPFQGRLFRPHHSFWDYFFAPFSCSLNSFFFKMSSHVFDTSPNPGDEMFTPLPTKTYTRTRCTARTAKGYVCRNKREQDCRYCKRHGQMVRITIPTIILPEGKIYMNELRPCPSCFDNVTYGEPCNSCISSKPCCINS